jgi:CheY-like chemotaxis protein
MWTASRPFGRFKMTIDLILTDLNLARSEGFDALQMIRSKPSLIGVPVGIRATKMHGQLFIPDLVADSKQRNGKTRETGQASRKSLAQ